MQESMQVSAVQFTLPHPIPEQLTTHVLPPQLTSPHAPPVGQLILHEYPAGHVTFMFPPSPLITHVMSAVHDEQKPGQPTAASEPDPPPPKTQ
jgi:hypothetical protein